MSLRFWPYRVRAEGRLAGAGKSGVLKRLAIDHCHFTGRVRGMLCWRCNGVLGRVADDPNLLLAMVAYLSRGVAKVA